MAVLIEGYSVVVRSSTIASKYPGGLDGYRRDCPNGSFCADEDLFMVERDAEHFIARLAAHGLLPFQSGVAEDVALVTQSGRPALRQWRWGCRRRL